MVDLVIHPISPERFGDLAELFGTRGDPSWCWCQYFLTTGRAYERSAAHNREALRSQVASARGPIGLIGYAAERGEAADAEPAVGWVQLGPRPTFPRIVEGRGVRAVARSAGDDLEDESVWAITCFVVKVGWRRKGIGAQLLAAAVDAARDAGASAVVGHPVDVSKRTTRVGGGELYHGAASTFARAGFREMGRTGQTRPVMRLDL